MKWWIIAIIIGLVIACWIGSVNAYHAPSRHKLPVKTHQVAEFNPSKLHVVGLLAFIIWFIIAGLAVVLLAPIFFVVELFRRSKPRPPKSPP
jgi:hypothetical protein